MSVVRMLAVALLISIATAGVNGANSQEFPSRTVTIVVPFPAGGGSDAIARLLANHLEQRWKRSVIVDNRPGGSSVIGTTAVARAEPDGYTLLFTAPTLTVFKATMKNPPLDVEQSFAPISQVITSPYLVAVNASLPVKTMSEFIAYAKSNPGKLNYGTIAGGAHLAIDLIRTLAGLDMVAVPFKGSVPLVTALARDDVQFGLDAIITLKPLIDSGKIRAIAVTSAERVPTMPELQTVAEAGVPGYKSAFWFGLLAPARTPNEIVHKIYEGVAEFMQRPDIISRMRDLGYFPVGSTPDQFRGFITSEIALWDKVARDTGYHRE